MTKTEREQLQSQHALIRGLLRRGEAREALAVLCAIRLEHPRHSFDALADQLALPLRIRPDDVVEGCPLAQGVKALICVARQRTNEGPTQWMRSVGTSGRKGTGEGRGSSSSKKRGVGYEMPTCVTERCSVGRAVREDLDVGDVKFPRCNLDARRR